MRLREGERKRAEKKVSGRGKKVRASERERASRGREDERAKRTYVAPDEEGGIEPRRTEEPVEACEAISMALAEAAAKVVTRAERERGRGKRGSRLRG